MTKKELLKWINKELKYSETKEAKRKRAISEWWGGNYDGWVDTLKKIKEIYYK